MNKADLGDLRFAEGAHLLIKRALINLAYGEEILVRGSAPDLEVQLEAWARAEGHELRVSRKSCGFKIRKGSAQSGRWKGAERTGDAHDKCHPARTNDSSGRYRHHPPPRLPLCVGFKTIW